MDNGQDEFQRMKYGEITYTPSKEDDEIKSRTELRDVIVGDAELLDLYRNNAWFYRSIEVLIHSSASIKNCVTIIADLSTALENDGKTRHMP